MSKRKEMYALERETNEPCGITLAPVEIIVLSFVLRREKISFEKKANEIHI